MGSAEMEMFKPVNQVDLSCCTKEGIRRAFETMYSNDENLFLSLKDDSVFYMRPDRLRLPLIFYYGHTACVYVNKLMLSGYLKERINLDLETMFETGVDEFSWDDVDHLRFGGAFHWPTVREVTDYRNQVKDKILTLIEEVTLQLPADNDSFWWALMMGISHEAIHFETSSVLIRQLPVELVNNPGLRYGPIKTDSPVLNNPFLFCEAANVTFGKARNISCYDWDCAYGKKTCRVESFAASKYLITNRQFLEFVNEGGYENNKFWSDEGWNWCQYRQARHPTFWICDEGCENGCAGELASKSHCIHEKSETKSNGGMKIRDNSQLPEFRLRVLFDVIDLPLDWPVEVNYHEAKAYCRWRGEEYRLPIEAEREIMRGQQEMAVIQFPAANVNLAYGSPTPVNKFPPSSAGFHDLGGNVWEWYEDSFNGFPGFKTDYLYDDYSIPCFDEKHTLIKGGSWVSTFDQGAIYSRNGFRRHFFQHAGFRMVKNLQPNVELPVTIVGCSSQPESTTIFLDRNRYNFQLKVSANKQYRFQAARHMHDNLRKDYFPNSQPTMSVKIVDKLFILKDNLATTDRYTDTGNERALIIGAATGVGAFHLATKSVKEILAVDCSSSFIKAAEDLKKGKILSVNIGDSITKQLRLPYSLHTRNKVQFKQLTWLPNEVGFFDIVIFNHVDRLNNARAWIARLKEIVYSAGVVAICAADYDVIILTSYIGDSFSYIGCDEVDNEKTVETIYYWVKN